ncbi:MAG: hypothetical protein AABX01_02300 [Candidatus Micrarchaeota archaeon]
MAPSAGGVFSLSVFMLMLLSLFSPFAYASTYYYDYYDDGGGKEGSNGFGNIANSKIISLATPPSQLNFADEEVRDFTTFEGTCQMAEMDAAEVARYQKGLLTFQTEQLSTLSDSALRKNDPTNQTTQNIQININLADQPVYGIKDIANLLEYDEKGREEIAKEFGIDSETGKLNREQIRAIASRTTGGQDKLAQVLGISQQGEIPKPAYEAYKVVLPNGKSVALKDIMKTQPQEKENQCLIDRSFIHGKVTFQALLNKDVLLGFDQSKTTVKAPQHITTKQTTAALNSYAGSMVIPRMYEKYVTTVGQWSNYEMWASLAGAASILFSRQGVNGLKLQMQDDKEQLERLSKLNQGRLGDSLKGDELLNEGLEANRRIEGNEKLMRQLDFETSVQKWKPVAIMLYGAGWMGAARIALSASNQILFSSLVTNDKKLKDNYLQIYVNNNDFLTDFRRASDFFGTGKITDWASDLMEAGAPTKAFETGKVFYITRDSTPEEQYSDSYTSFEQKGTGWQVKMDWKGQAESSLFEDVRKGGDYTSFALYSNNLELGTTIKNNAEFAKYYQSMAVLAPLVNFLIYRRADIQYLSGPVSTITRAGIFDFVVTRLVDPVRFSKDEVCDEEIVDNMLLKYRIFTGVSIVQSASNVVWPNQGFLQVLGGAFKASFLKGLSSKTTGFFSKAQTELLTKTSGEINELKLLAGEEYAAKASSIKLLTQAEQSGLRQGNPAYNKLYNDFLHASDQHEALAKQITTKTQEFRKLDPYKTELKYTTMEKATANLYKAIVLLDPVQLGKQVIASRGFEYVSLCKDTSYKILAYQKISADKANQNLQKKFDQITKIDVGKQLNLSGLLGGIGSKVEEKSLTEMLNLRAIQDNPYGQLNPEDLFYIHLDGATQQWFGVYDKLAKNGCFRECHDSKDGFVCVDDKGVTYTDKKTGKSLKLSSNPDRGLLSLMMQDLARTLIPNRIISAGLDNACYESEILQVTPGSLGGNLLITNDGCSTMDCLRQQLKTLKIDVGSDLSASGFGRVVAVYTTEGRITADEGKIRYIRSTGRNATEILGIDVPEALGGEEAFEAGEEIQAPSIEAMDELGAGAQNGNLISIMGNGDVLIKGHLREKKGIEEVQAGTLLTIITERGRIEFDENGKRLVVALYILAKTKAADNIKAISTSIKNTIDENGKSVPGISIDNVIPKVGGEKEAQEMKEALDKVQTDANGNRGGFTLLETPDKKYVISTDENGKQVLSVIDKKTGEQTDYNITGPLRREGNDIIVPTDRGDFKFNLDMKNGQPVLSAQGPDGLLELAALLAAKGAGGMIAFDPRTGLWYALNGQDIPWNDEFAKRGLSLYNTPEGTRGIPGDNLYGYQTRQGTSSNSTPFSIPSFPEQFPYALMMLGAIVAGVMAVRIIKLK